VILGAIQLDTESKFKIAAYGILIASIILHEISHGWSALALGDDTAKRAGRLTLNPIPHIDLIGSLLLPGFLIATGSPFLFGWAKPVPVNVSRLRHPRNDAVLTALAGPATNLVLTGIAYVALRQLHPESFWPLNLLLYMGLINIWLACFNLLPVPPLDGSSVIERFLPKKWWGPYLQIRPYTMLIVLGVVILGQTSGVFNDVFNSIANRWYSVTGYG
jgi:Zn-dependent protease